MVHAFMLEGEVEFGSLQNATLGGNDAKEISSVGCDRCHHASICVNCMLSFLLIPQVCGLP